MKLLYVGRGAFIPDVPARDLNAAESEFYGVDRLLESGLYIPAVEIGKKKSTRLETADADGGN